ncbi:SGNH/GDSL hydrolase family protein [bacterium]|nr:SGNH/GDSL hydrolase family protein [bacterium]
MQIYVIADSISLQYGPYLQANLAGVMGYARKEGEEEALLNLDNPTGANGGDSGMVLAFLEAKKRAGGIDADLLLVNCGLHDIKTDPVTGRKQVPIDQYEANLRAIINVTAQMRSRLIWARTTPCDEAIHNHAGMAFHRFAADNFRYNAAADAVMQRASVPILDLYTFTRNLGPGIYCDHVHFHEDVRRQQAAFIAGWLMAFTR